MKNQIPVRELVRGLQGVTRMRDEIRLIVRVLESRLNNLTMDECRIVDKKSMAKSSCRTTR